MRVKLSPMAELNDPDSEAGLESERDPGVLKFRLTLARNCPARRRGRDDRRRRPRESVEESEHASKRTQKSSTIG